VSCSQKTHSPTTNINSKGGRRVWKRREPDTEMDVDAGSRTSRQRCHCKVWRAPELHMAPGRRLSFIHVHVLRSRSTGSERQWDVVHDVDRTTALTVAWRRRSPGSVKHRDTDILLALSAKLYTTRKPS